MKHKPKDRLDSLKLTLAHTKFSKLHLLIFALIFGSIGAYVLFHGSAAGFTANIYVVASGGSPNCVRSATLVDYNTALTNNNVCGYGNGNMGYVASAWGNACKAAATANTSTGTLIGVKSGNYSSPSGGRLFEGDPHFDSSSFDCSGGLGAAVNPNAAEQGVSTGTTAAWAHYECADGDTTKNVNFTAGGQNFLWGNFHAVIEGGCFNFDSIAIGAGGYPVNVRSSELQFIGGPNCSTNTSASDCIHMIGLDIKGAKDILIKNVDYGPSLQCAKNDPVVNPAYRCDPAVPFEAPYANLGTATAACGINDIVDCGGTFSTSIQPQSYIHYGDGSAYQNIRVQNMYQHDANQVFASNLVHSGCTMDDNSLGNLPAFNLVFDHLVCERFEILGQQNADSGVTIENSVFGCATYQLDQATPAGAWDSCANQSREMDIACRADLSPGCVVSNEIIRYNVFLGGSYSLLFRIPGGAFGTYSNVQVIGNIFAQAPSSCTITGITCDYNTFLSGATPAGTHATVLSTASPFVNDNVTSLNHLWQDKSTLDAHIKPNLAMPTIPDLGTAYHLATDADGKTRVYPTWAGSYENPAAIPPTGGTPPPTGGSSSPPPNGSTPKTGDCNADNKVDVLDLSILLAHYNQSLAGISYGDLNSSGKVDVLDLSILLANYGR